MSCLSRAPTIRRKTSATLPRPSSGILNSGSGKIPTNSCGRIGAGPELLHKPHLPLTVPPPHSLIEAKTSGERHHNHVSRPQRQVSDWPGGAPSGLSIPGCDLRYRPELLQHRGVVSLHSPGGAAGQGPALLSPARRERGQRVHRLRLGAESRARHLGRAAAPPSGVRAVRGLAGRSLPLPLRPGALSAAGVRILATNEKAALSTRPLC